VTFKVGTNLNMAQVLVQNRVALAQPILPDVVKQIGVTVKQNVVETAGWLSAQKSGDFEVSTNAPCNSIVEPDMDLHWYLTTSPVNFSKHKDTVMDDLYQKQSRAIDPEERRKHLRAFEKRLYDDEAHFIMTFQWNRIIPHLSKVRGYTITPSHFLNCQLDTVWLSE
jgi:peptide/nickel transport system substrate-binding protein